MPRIRIVVYKSTIKAYLDSEEIPITRLPDLTPLYIETVNPDSSGALVLEGEAWHGINDDFFSSMLQYEIPTEEKNKPKPRIVKSSSGNIIIEEHGKSVELTIIYKGKRYVLKLRKSPMLKSYLNPYLLSLKFAGYLDNEMISFLLKELRDNNIREYLRTLTEQ